MSEGAGGEAPRTAGLGGAAVLFAALGLAAALGALGLVPPALARAAAAPVVFLGAGYPVLARRSGADSAPLKLLCFGALASPIVIGSIDLALRLVVAPEQAAALALAVGGALPLVARRERVSTASPGRAGLAALAIAVGLALLVAAFVLGGNAPRVSFHGLLHSSVLLATERGLPPENPWLAGHELAYYWYWHALGGFLVRAFHCAPTTALASFDVWAAFTLPLALYYLAAPLWRDARSDLLSVGLALFGLNALGGWLWLARSAPYDAPASSGELLEALRPLVGSWDPRLAFGISKLGNVSSYPAALALAVGGWAAAAHALRHARPPWVLACSFLHGASLAVNPLVGAVALAPTAVAALSVPGVARVRSRLLPALLVASLPGLAMIRGASEELSRDAFSVDVDLGRTWRLVAPLLLLLPPACLLALGRRSREDARGRRAILGLLVAAALGIGGGYLALEIRLENEYKLVRIAAIPLGILAAGGLGVAWRRGGAARKLAHAAFWPLAIGLVANNGLGIAGYLALARVDLPVVERPGTLQPIASEPPATDLAAAYRHLREEVRPAHPDAILLMDVLAPGTVWGGEEAPAFAFIDAQNRQGHEAAAFTRLPLWCDRRTYLVDSYSDWTTRLEGIYELYEHEADWDERHRNRLLATGRPIVILVTARDRELNPELPGKLHRFGWAPLVEAGGELGSVALWVWPRELAEPGR